MHQQIQGNTLQHTATHCNAAHYLYIQLIYRELFRSANTLQRKAQHCITLQHTTTYCDILRHTTIHCNTLQHTALHCNSLQYLHTQLIYREIYGNTMQRTVLHCNALYYVATHCNTLQNPHTQLIRQEMHGNTLHHTALHAHRISIPGVFSKPRCVITKDPSIYAFGAFVLPIRYFGVFGATCSCMLYM